MTKVQNPIIGRAKGSAGGMTFSKTYDKNVMRAKAFEVSNPNTQAQQTQRGFFSELQGLVASFTPEQLRFLFPSKPKAMSRRNALSKQIAEHYTTSGNTKSVDLSDITTLGNAPKMDFGTTEVGNTSNGISIDLDSSVVNDATYTNNRFAAVLMNTTKGEIALPLKSTPVTDSPLVIPRPNGWEQTDTIVAVPLITDNTDTANELTSFENVSVMRRPL